MHITGKIIGYAHSFCNQKVRENKNQISVIADNLFGFDFFFFLKGLRLGVWRTKNISIGGTYLININFGNIINQIKFIDTLKYYEQSLSVLASTMTEQEKKSIRNECEKFIKNDQKLNKKLYKCTIEDRDWILNYLFSGKGVIPYEMITRFDLLDIAPENDVFFLPHNFYSSLKKSIISNEDYNAVKILYRTMCLQNLGELNKLYNFQDTIILYEIFESR